MGTKRAGVNRSAVAEKLFISRAGADVPFAAKVGPTDLSLLAQGPKKPASVGQ
jgi:hypothetical protein